ncbi:hypothetical protein F4703DRAFT_1120191 [Phycomyces blakesleeanus]
MPRTALFYIPLYLQYSTSFISISFLCHYFVLFFFSLDYSCTHLCFSFLSLSLYIIHTHIYIIILYAHEIDTVFLFVNAETPPKSQ